MFKWIHVNYDNSWSLKKYDYTTKRKARYTEQKMNMLLEVVNQLAERVEALEIKGGE